MKKRNYPKPFSVKMGSKNIPAAKLPDEIAIQLSPMQAEILVRVMNDNANHRVDDLIASHGDMADAVIAGLTGTGLASQFSEDQKVTLYGMIKLGFLWGVRAQQEDWTARYQITPSRGAGST